MKKSIASISEFPGGRIDDKEFWQLVRQRLNVVNTLNEITPKSIPRSGIAMTKAIYQLLDALNEYEKMRVNR